MGVGSENGSQIRKRWLDRKIWVESGKLSQIGNAEKRENADADDGACMI